MPPAAEKWNDPVAADPAAVPPFLIDGDLRLVLFGGKGGVGKTTCAVSAALAMAAAHPRDDILLVSTDPAHSLTDSLGNSAVADNLEIVEFDAESNLRRFKERNESIFREMARRGTFLDEGDIQQFLDLSLPGMDELMAFLEIARWAEEERYQTIVVDTAPTGHTLRLLQMPDLARRWLAALDTLLAKHRYMKKVFSGRYRTDAVDDFVLNLSGRIEGFSSLLRDSVRCRFVPVTQADHLSLYETRLLLASLKELDITVTDIVVNQMIPEGACAICEHKQSIQIHHLDGEARGLGSRRMWSLPLMPDELRGMDALSNLWNTATPILLPLADAEKTGRPAPAIQLTRLDGVPAVSAPLPAARLVMFAGKGGVGKTTLACATGTVLAAACPSEKILLFSTDPAHSLSGCLGRPVGPGPTQVNKNLYALEMDGPAEFEEIKQQYAQELAQFLENLAPNFDFTFDREVMERIMDLAPTGIDEVMAVTRAVDLLEQEEFHMLVLDAAPTGHLIRLLETPEIIRQWLRVFFDLFIKYKRIFRLPGISRRMVEISKGIKSLNERLQDPESAVVYGVSILTEMALAETQDLVAACRKLGVAMPVLLLNQATPPGDCPLCSALSLRERDVQEKFQNRMGDVQQQKIFYQPNIEGLKAIEAMGKQIYMTQRR